MQQFLTVFKFHYIKTITSKYFIISTVIFLSAIVIMGSLSQIKELLGGSKETEGKKAVIVDTNNYVTDEELYEVLGSYTWERSNDGSSIESGILSDDYELGIEVLNDGFDVYVKGSNTLSTSNNAINTMLKNNYMKRAFLASGVSKAEYESIMSFSKINIVSVGKDAGQSFAFVYVLLILLWMAIMLYGQYVMGAVVSEKTSRTMELLITSCRPTSLMFGMVVGAGLAGLTQMCMLMGAGFYAVTINGLNIMSLNTMLIYAVLYFLQGFFIYAFLYAAVGSTVSKMEDMNQVVMIPMMIFLISFYIAIFGIRTPEAMFIKVSSFIPFISPVVMFMRIGITDVPFYEILMSMVINVASLVAMGIVSSKVYRIGVMLYGNPPKLKELLRYIKAS